MTIDAAGVPVTVLHRLALGVECLDTFAIRSAPLVRVGREGLVATSRSSDLGWPCLDLEPSGLARFKLGHDRSLPTEFVLRIDDLTRRHVPRRFRVHPWPVASLEDTTGQAYVPVGSRVLRPWLWPGSAYPLPRGTTVVRGRIVHGGRPVRWARLVATGPLGAIAGRAHADDRGEFVLVITHPDQKPLQTAVPVDVRVIAPEVPGPVSLLDRCADLVVEDVPRSSAPPAPGDLDNAVLRGEATPAGYAANAHALTHMIVPVGTEFRADDIVFDPQP